MKTEIWLDLILLIRAQLEIYEASLRQAYEEHNQVQTQKRAELLDATFNAEMEQYRRLRETQVSSLYSRTHSTKSMYAMC